MFVKPTDWPPSPLWMCTERNQDLSLGLSTCLLPAPVTLSFELITPGPDFSLPSFRFSNSRLLLLPLLLPPPPPRRHIFNLQPQPTPQTALHPPPRLPPLLPVISRKALIRLYLVYFTFCLRLLRFIFYFSVKRIDKSSPQSQTRGWHMKERKSTHRCNPALHFLLSISEQLWPARGFNFRWEIEFGRDMICIRKCFRVSCVVYMQSGVRVGVRHKDHVIRVWQEGINMEKI